MVSISQICKKDKGLFSHMGYLLQVVQKYNPCKYVRCATSQASQAAFTQFVLVHFSSVIN